jgi:hypothetical protein
MPLPLLNPNTLEPTGEVLPLNEYFNPMKNPNWNGEYGSRSMYAQGKLSIPAYIRLAKAILTNDSIDELAIQTLYQYAGASYAENTVYRVAMRKIYEALPDEHKWMVLSVKLLSASTAQPNIYKFAAAFFIPDSTYSSEIARGSRNVEFFMTRSPDSTFSPSDAQLADLSNQISEIIPLCDEKWLQIPSEVLIYRDDFCFNYVVSRLSGFIANRPIYFPTGNDIPGVVFDWSSPSTIVQYASENIRIVISSKHNYSQLHFKASLPAGDRRALARVLNYSTNVLEHLPYIIKGPKEGSSPTYGIELESCSDYTPQQMIDAQKDLFFIMKQDGSISGSKPQKYEIVTVPATMKAHKRLWAELFEKIDYNKFDTTKDTGNGMHVHVGREFFSPKHLRRFCWFITNPAHFDFMFTISERPNRNDITRWAPMPNYNGYTKCGAIYNTVLSCSNLRGAVHFKGDKTVEVRMFKGIVSYATVVKNLEFVDSVFHFTQVTSLSQLTLKNYISWLQSTDKNRYTMIKAFIAEIPVKEILTTAEVLDYVWDEKTDYKIAERLNKAPFKITSAHITVLNKKRRVRAFILKNGLVHCVRNNGGLLAKLDKSLSQKQTRGAATLTRIEFAA